MAPVVGNIWLVKLSSLHCSLWPIQTINFPSRDGATGVSCEVKSAVALTEEEGGGLLVMGGGGATVKYEMVEF